MTLSEWRTRKTRIDRQLTGAGWKVTPHRDGGALSTYGRAAIEEFPTSSGPSDYLLTDGGKPLAAVEAKKLSLGPRNALTQTLRYARGIEDTSFDFDGVRIPFGYSTNGEHIYFQ